MYVRSVLQIHVLLYLLTTTEDTKNYRMDFHKTWMEDTSQPRIDPSNLWGVSENFCSYSQLNNT